jgi:hypothetical protein
MAPFEQFDQPNYAGVLLYLQQRFMAVETYDDIEGYVLR